jgi:hypothetical protein
MLNENILSVVAAQSGAISEGGSRDLFDKRFVRAFARVLFLFLANATETEIPIRSWIFPSNTEISIESDQYEAIKSQIDRAFQLSFEYDWPSTPGHSSSSLGLP